MVIIYADLVELGIRTVSEEKSKETGVILVPTLYRDKVVAELERRGTYEGIYA
ncbi:CD1375 family protein [Kurthia populi]|uniref:CD1375 family protein n=1 Tax=Kurthia populi TaxID=1562132 RepID=A0ABW5Y4C8_9BACL